MDETIFSPYFWCILQRVSFQLLENMIITTLLMFINSLTGEFQCVKFSRGHKKDHS